MVFVYPSGWKENLWEVGGRAGIPGSFVSRAYRACGLDKASQAWPDDNVNKEPGKRRGWRREG